MEEHKLWYKHQLSSLLQSSFYIAVMTFLIFSVSDVRSPDIFITKIYGLSMNVHDQDDQLHLDINLVVVQHFTDERSLNLSCYLSCVLYDYGLLSMI